MLSEEVVCDLGKGALLPHTATIKIHNGSVQYSFPKLHELVMHYIPMHYIDAGMADSGIRK